MKLQLIFLLGFLFQSYAGVSQTKRFNIEFENVTLKRALAILEENTEYSVIYKDELINSDRKYSSNFQDKSITEVLDGLLSSEPLTYTIKGRVIVLLPKEGTEVSGQKKLVVKGTVIGEEGEPVPGATVIIKGSTIGTITDADGKYEIQNVSDNAVLIFSFVGMKTQEVQVDNRTNINVKLEAETIGLEEVVAVGYGTMKKSDLTGSISAVSSEDFERVPTTSPLQALSGRAAGLTITQTSGMPGAGSEVLVRGVQSLSTSDSKNKPIYVVDGTITDNIDNLSPNDIESISVLKDASAAAIYGSRAANGVILVTTKRGKTPGKVTITFDSYVGLQGESNLRPNVMNSQQYLELINEAYDNRGVSKPWTDADLEQYSGVNTNWKDLITRTGILQNYSLGVAGSSESSNYFVSGSYQNNKGRVISTDYERYTMRFNSDHHINKWITFGNSLNVFSAESNGSTSLYRAALVTVPITRPFEEDGSWGRIRNRDLEGGGNPLYSANRDIKKIVTRGLLGNVFLTIEPLKNLKLTARESVEWNHRYLTNFEPRQDPILQYGGGAVTQVTKQAAQTLHTTSDFLLNYDKTFGDVHSISVLLGYSIEDWNRETLEAFRSGTPNNNIRYITAGDPTTATNDNAYDDWASLSMFGRINYNYNDKYLLAVTFRRDGTSRLVSANRWGNFPSVSGAWRIKSEPFMSGIDFISAFKIRASIGTLGNEQNLSNYATTTSLSSLLGSANQAIYQGYSLANAVNSDVVWESTVKKGIGTDFALFNNHIRGTFDYYREDTKDLIFNRPIADSAGKTSDPSDNGPSVRNSGIELEIGYSNNAGNWRYNINANFSTNKNKVTDLAGEEESLRTSGIVVGKPVGSFFGYKSNGIIKTQADFDNNPYLSANGTEVKKELGDIWWMDVNGRDSGGNLVNEPDGVVNADDRTIIGSRYPDFSYGFVGGVSYKNVGIQVQLQGVHGVDKDISTQNDFGLFHYFQRWALNHDDHILDRWHATKNPDGNMPRVDISDKGRNRVLSDFWLRDASYLRIRNVNIYYNFPESTLERLGMSNLSVYFSVQNLYTFTKFIGNEVEFGEDRYKDSFPDTALPNDSDPITGVPQPRTWTFGVKATF